MPDSSYLGIASVAACCEECLSLIERSAIAIPTGGCISSGSAAMYGDFHGSPALRAAVGRVLAQNVLRVGGDQMGSSVEGMAEGHGVVSNEAMDSQMGMANGQMSGPGGVPGPAPVVGQMDSAMDTTMDAGQMGESQVNQVGGPGPAGQVGDPKAAVCLKHMMLCNVQIFQQRMAAGRNAAPNVNILQPPLPPQFRQPMQPPQVAPAQLAQRVDLPRLLRDAPVPTRARRS